MSNSPWFYPRVGYAGGYTLTTLPANFVYGTPYQWFVAVYGPDGSYAESYERRSITFASPGAGAP